MAESRFAGDPARLGQAYTERLGPFTFGLIHRSVAGDKGYTIHVMGPADGREAEVLRFDCFEKGPHYHLGVTNRDGPIVPIEDDHPFEWAVEQIRNSFGDLLKAAGADDAYRAEWSGELGEALDRIVRQAM